MLEALDDVLATHKRHLLEAGVRVYLLAAYGPRAKDGSLKGPAIKHGGYAARGVTRIVPVKLRVAGLGDVEVVLDGDRWTELAYEEQLALIDHELTHVDLVLDDESPVLDDAGRPKLRRRLHDHQHGWFNEVAERHGIAAQEVQQASRFADEHGQLYFGGWARPAQQPRRIATPPVTKAAKRARQPKAEPLPEPEDRPLAKGGKLPRRDCSVCGRSVPVRVGGELREHTVSPGGPKCSGSVESMAGGDKGDHYRRARAQAISMAKAADVPTLIANADIETLRLALDHEEGRKAPRRSVLGMLDAKLDELVAQQRSTQAELDGVDRMVGAWGRGEVETDEERVEREANELLTSPAAEVLLESASIEVVRRAMELAGGRARNRSQKRKRRALMTMLERRLAELLELEGDAGEASTSTEPAIELGVDPHPSTSPSTSTSPPKRRGINPANVLHLFDKEPAHG